MARGKRTAGASGRIAPRSSLAIVVLAACVGALLGGACATTGAEQRRWPHALIALDGAPPELGHAMGPALQRLDERGLALAVRTTVIVHPTAEAFRRSTGQLDPGLRAWTTWRTVHLMPLHLWARSGPASVIERLAHELCHAAVYQRFGSEERAKAARIPRFFEEGTCSVVGGQGASRMPVDDVVALAPPMPFDVAVFRGDPELAYAAAHHAMALLDETRGKRFLARVLDDAASDGTPGCVERALERAIGTDARGLWRMLVDSVGQAT